MGVVKLYFRSVFFDDFEHDGQAQSRAIGFGAQTLVKDRSRHAAMVASAARFSEANRGAVDKTAAAVLHLLREQGVDAL